MSILSKDLTGVDISRPLLKKGPVEFEIAEMKVEKSNAGDKDLLVITLKSKHSEDGIIVKGDGQQTPTTLKPGFPLTHRITITPTEKRDEQRVLEDLKKFRMCATGDESGAFGDPSAYVGKSIIANLDIEDGGDYGWQNRVKSWIKKGK